ncbi:MAG: hypothetical protein ACREVJ_15965, partial [Gammaproteobacteria bacterium]
TEQRALGRPYALGPLGRAILPKARAWTALPLDRVDVMAAIGSLVEPRIVRTRRAPIYLVPGSMTQVSPGAR